MPVAKIHDLNMYYEIHGEGPSLILIPGLASDISEYGHIIELLARDHTVLAIDNRGVGRTDEPDAPYSIEMMADDAAMLIRQLDFGSADVMGFSMGGRIALDLALRYPRYVKRLVLVSTSARVIKTLRRKLLLSLLPRTPLFKGRYPQPYYAFVRQNKASSSYDCTEQLSAIHIPTLILHGSRDKLASPLLTAELHRGIKDSKLVEVPGGHTFFFVRYSRLAQIIEGFLSPGAQ